MKINPILKLMLLAIAAIIFAGTTMSFKIQMEKKLLL